MEVRGAIELIFQIIWAIGGNVGSPSNKVESYDPLTNSWKNEVPLLLARNSATTWVANEKIYAGGGYGGDRKVH